MPATLGVVGGFALMRVLDNAFTLLALNRDGAVDGDPLPSHVQREFRRHLEWGILAHGFAGARLGERGHDFLIALSCKGRGVCPSCNTRRMVETAAHLADNVFPRLPARQWALAVPRRLRYFLHCDAVLQGAALRLFLHAAMTALAVPAVTTPAAPPVSPLSRFSTAASGAPSCLEWVAFRHPGWRPENLVPVTQLLKDWVL